MKASVYSMGSDASIVRRRPCDRVCRWWAAFHRTTWSIHSGCLSAENELVRQRRVVTGRSTSSSWRPSTGHTEQGATARLPVSSATDPTRPVFTATCSRVRMEKTRPVWGCLAVARPNPTRQSPCQQNCHRTRPAIILRSHQYHR